MGTRKGSLKANYLLEAKNVFQSLPIPLPGKRRDNISILGDEHLFLPTRVHMSFFLFLSS